MKPKEAKEAFRISMILADYSVLTYVNGGGRCRGGFREGGGCNVSKSEPILINHK